MPLAPSLVGGGVRGVSFWVYLSPLFPPCSTRHDSLIASTRRPHALAAPRMGHISCGLEKWLRLTLGFLEVPLGFLGNPPPGWSPPSVLLGISGVDFWSCRAACGLPAPSALGILRVWNTHALCRGWVPAVR